MVNLGLQMVVIGSGRQSQHVRVQGIYMCIYDKLIFTQRGKKVIQALFPVAYKNRRDISFRWLTIYVSKVL